MHSTPSRVAHWMALSLGLSTAACGGAEAGAGPGSTQDGGTTDGVASDDGGASEAGEGGPAADSGGPWTAIPLSSCVGSIYTATVTIGGSQAFQAIVDTGSTTFGVASSKCTDCTGVTPSYTPGSSATDEKQTVNAAYGSGSWTGELYQDSIAPGTETPIPVKFAAINTQSTFFQPAQCDSKIASYQAILGLGPTGAALKGTQGYFDELVAQQHVPDVFATELCTTGGTLWLGGYDPAATTAPPVYTPMAPGVDTVYYAITLTSITVNGTTVPVASAQYSLALVDTGTSIFILGQTAFNAVTAAIAASPGFAPIFGSSGAAWFNDPNNCVAVPKTKAEIDAALPALTLTFGSGVTAQAAPTESYLQSAEGDWCPAMIGQAQGQSFPAAAVMGSPILKSNVVVFDRANSRIGFAPHAACN